ncbi:MAG: hypothetical protein QXJ74_08895 [Nitrososphaera sp.]|uniref:hypothetical protein n=1 Tax=Nitrososphaera sp. TaxID=1971748 RepID=UPI0031748B73
MSLEITKSLKEALAHLYYREACDQKGWAYVSVGDIEIRDNVVVFAKGPHRISIRFPAQIIAEIKEISKLGSKNKPLFDYLACKVSQREKYEGVMVANPTALSWMQVKTRKEEFSEKEADALEKIKLPLTLFYVRDVLAQPQKIETKWDTRTGDEWLDELDDKRDQAESDDDFL